MSKQALRIVMIGWLERGDLIPFDAINTAQRMALDRAKTNPDDTAVEIEWFNINGEYSEMFLKDDCKALESLVADLFGDEYQSTVGRLVRAIKNEKVAKEMIREMAKDWYDKKSANESQLDPEKKEEHLKKIIDSAYESFTKKSFNPRAGIIWFLNRSAPKPLKDFIARKFNIKDLPEKATITVFETNTNDWSTEELCWSNQNVTHTRDSIKS